MFHVKQFFVLIIVVNCNVSRETLIIKKSKTTTSIIEVALKEYLPYEDIFLKYFLSY